MAFETAFDRLSMVSQTTVGSGWDLATLFSDAAEVFVYVRGKTRFNLKGIFDDAYQGVEVAEAEFASSQPMITLPTSALPIQPQVGDKAIVDCVVYVITNFKADGTGVTVLMLEATTDLDAP